MSTLIFDIETVGENFDVLDTATQDVLTRWIRKETSTEGYLAALEDLKNGLGFSPLTGEIAAIGVLDHERGKGAVYYQTQEKKEEVTEDAGIKYKPMTEKEMLVHFWKGVAEYDEFVSFNGRGFDVPFLVIRSAVHGIKPTKDLMSNRYLESQTFGAKHVDLLDQLTFYGAVRRKGNLHLWCRMFGIKSPKVDGVNGDDVGGLFRTKKFIDIAHYNARDLRATQELYQKWKDYIKM